MVGVLDILIIANHKQTFQQIDRIEVDLKRKSWNISNKIARCKEGKGVKRWFQFRENIYVVIT